MPSGPEAAVREYADPAALPDDAAALFGRDFFSTLAWYRVVVAHGLPAGARPVFVVVSVSRRAAAVFPMMVARRQASALTTPYTCLWQPLLAVGLDAPALRSVWREFAMWCRGFGTVRLEAMAEGSAASLASGLRAGGLVALPFRHFGNRHGSVAKGWPAYWSARPGQVREAVRRRGKKLMTEGWQFEVITSADEVARGIAAYEAVYAKSWKAPEPFPDFNPALMRRCACDGTLRLGLLTRGGEVLAAQLWVVRENWAAVLKLAHDEAAKAFSPGTVLTARMIEYLATRDGVVALDFGRGDDPYKADWTEARCQRMGVILANPWRASGLAAMGRGMLGRVAKNLKSWAR